MRYYLAPMEGITGYIYRRAQHALFPAFDKYFSPFLAPRPKKTFNAREVRDILPENNEGMVLVPQILTNGQGNPDRTSMTLIMFLNSHLKSRNYGMAGALSVYLFIVSGILCFFVYRMTNGSDSTAKHRKHAKGGTKA